jgi:hypothetical protein
MNARLAAMCAVITLALAVSAQADWFRPRTWGEKKPTAARQKQNRGGVFTPFAKKKKDNPHDGAGRFFRPDVTHRKKESDTKWYRPVTWFRETEPEKPLTVTDWMALDRPEFENRDE